ncbi:MAG TPA: phosphatase PAP2 family protein [Candidatus Dormibacteraeota bacterium]|nr:phosphatase PAP2 family protein [Candidatus Dormibacteraeota bacterium]
MDYQLEQLINGPAGSHPLWDRVMTTIAVGAEPAFIALVVLWLLVGLWRRSPRDRTGAVLAALAAGIGLVINAVIAHLWFRPRPFVAHPGTVHLLVRHTSDASFPSDHAVGAFAIAAVLLSVHRKLGALAIVAALLVAYARVYVGDHYPGDVAAGALVGLVAAWLCAGPIRPFLAALDDWVSEWLGARWLQHG